jgi:DNA-binding beta-propeller fold protein YncE
VLKKAIKVFLICLSLCLFSSCISLGERANNNRFTENNEAEINATNLSSLEDGNIEEFKIGEMKEVIEVKSENVYEDFCQVDSNVCAGILFDKEGTMLVASPLGLNRISSDGTVSLFCDFSNLKKGYNFHFISPLIWDMKYDNDNNIIAAAQDRILKIDQNGNVTTLIQEDFQGFLGASGLEIDKEGNMYVVSGGKVYKYSKDLVKTEYYSTKDYNSFFSIAFTPDNKYLYLTDFYTKALVKYEINPDGTVGEGKEIIREAVKDSGAYGAPLNIVFSDSGNIYVSIDGMAYILKIDKDENLELLYMNKDVRNHIIAWGKEAFEEDYIYFTTYGNKVCKFKLDKAS